MNSLKNKNPYNQLIYKGFLWSHMDSNHGPPDYESGALTN